MFIITRNIDGQTETLKDTSTQTVKTFNDFYTANLFLKKLNQNIVPSKHWTVTKRVTAEDC